MICTLGNFATKLLTGNPRGITQVHGRPQVTEIAGHELYLFPIFKPAAALYTPANLATLKEDFLRLPDLLAARGAASGERLRASGLAAARAPAAALAGPAAAPALADVAPTLDDPAIAAPTLEEAAIAALDATPVEAASEEAAPAEAAPGRPLPRGTRPQRLLPPRPLPPRPLPPRPRQQPAPGRRHPPWLMRR